MKAPIESSPRQRQSRPLIALVGNPNTGKSTLFNRLTGLRQHIANYPGITVEKKSGLLRTGGIDLDLLDLPGCYSLTAVSNDERVVMDVLGGRRGLQKPDLLVFVVDATNLKRNLLLVSQCAELGIPALIALNQCDAAKRNGIRIDAVSDHFKMHHLWSLQSAPPLTGVFLGFLGSFWQGVFLFP